MKITLIRPPAYSTGLMGAQLVPFWASPILEPLPEKPDTPLIS